VTAFSRADLDTLSNPNRPGNNFDFLRFALASLVVLSHSFPLATGTEHDEPLAWLTRGQLTFGALAVDGFFVISGFLVLQSWRRDPRVVSFLRKRILRVYPGFLVAAVLGAFVIAPAYRIEPHPALDTDFVGRFVFDALRLQADIPWPSFDANPAPGTVNGSLWSIPYEAWCYVMVLIAGLMALDRRRWLVAGTFALFVVVGFIFEWRHLTPGGHVLGQIFGYPPLWARLLPFFLAGMTYLVWRERIPLTVRGAVVALLALTIAARVPHGMTVALPTAGTYLLFWFAFRPVPRLSRFAARGDFSYGIYLFSFPILQMVVHHSSGSFHPLVLFVLGWPLTLLAAVLSWHLVEKHCIHLSHARAPASAAVAGTSA
jgi:peptidoglycan/LPS O-acetylase OafA/YrhL